MCDDKSRAAARLLRRTSGTLIACLAILSIAGPAYAIPTFSRKYRTSCITCHTVFPKLNAVGEAFRRNGYQFASGEELLVKDEPVPFGNDAYKDMFPDSVWPSDMPTLPPVFVRGQLRSIIHADRGSDGVVWDNDFPHELVLGGAGSFGKNISAWWELEAEPSEDEIGVERLFIQFSNLFAWDEEDDEDGMRAANRWFALPQHALNLRIGKMQPQVLPQVASQHSRISIQQGLSNRQRIGTNSFRFEPVQSAAAELHGIIRQYTSYVVGIANGGAESGGQLDDNNHKDVYFRVSRKWFGFPLDGEISSVESEDLAGVVRGQSPDEDIDGSLPGLDFWRAWSFETGLFGWWGKSKVAFDPAVMGSPFVNDDFRRLGVDARLQWFDLDIYGLGYIGHDDFAGLVSGTNLGVEDHYSYLVQADYMWNPWILSFLRYEQTFFNEAARADQEESRVIPGLVLLIRQNMKYQMEWDIDTRGNDNGGGQATDQIRMQLDFAY